jgi:large subunit ribosomal protein L10
LKPKITIHPREEKKILEFSEVKEEKIAKAEELKKTIEQYPVIGLVDMFKLPSKQLQEIKKKIRGKGAIKMTKKSLLEVAINNSSKPNVAQILPQGHAERRRS